MQMSPLTRELTHYRAELYKDLPQDTAIEKIKTGLYGRVLVLGISLILHAEAVCRAVYLCFLHLQEIFSSSDEQLQKHWAYTEMAYAESLKSFFGLFDKKALIQQQAPQICEEQSQALLPQIIPQEEPQIHKLPEELVIVQPQHAIPKQPEPDIAGVLGYVVVQHPDAPKVEPELKIHEDYFVDDDEKRPLDESEIPLDFHGGHFGLLRGLGKTDGDSSSTDGSGDSPKGPRVSQDFNGRRFVGAESPEATPRDESSDDDVERQLYLASYEAGHQLTTDRQILFQFHPQAFDKWELGGGLDPVNQYPVGFCSSAKDTPLAAKHLFCTLEVKIKGRTHLVPLFGVFDPIANQSAAEFLYEHLEAALSKSLSKHNRQGWTPTGICKAIRSAIKTLSDDFTTLNSSSSLTIALLIGTQLWVAQLGTSGAILDSKGQEILLSTSSNTAFGRKNSKLKITRNDLGPNNTLILGTSSIFETTDAKSIVRWVSTHKTRSPKDLAYDIASSVARETPQQNKPISCLVVSTHYAAIA